MGCIYLATEAATGNKVLNNRCHDVMHATEDPDGYGGNGIYIDSTTHGVLVQNNLVYRVSQAGLQNTIGAQSPTDAPNIIQNNIFAYSLQGTLVHGGGSPVSTLYFSFHNNLVYFDKGSIQKRGYWYCWNTACSSIYDFAGNAYWNTNGMLATLPNAFFVTNANGGIIQNYSFAGWQGIGEDPGGVVADPHFTNPIYPADDFSLKDTSVADQVGFVPFDTNAPGRTSKVLNPPAVPAGFPLTLLNPTTDY